MFKKMAYLSLVFLISNVCAMDLPDVIVMSVTSMKSCSGTIPVVLSKLEVERDEYGRIVDKTCLALNWPIDEGGTNTVFDIKRDLICLGYLSGMDQPLYGNSRRRKDQSLKSSPYGRPDQSFYGSPYKRAQYSRPFMVHDDERIGDVAQRASLLSIYPAPVISSLENI